MTYSVWDWNRRQFAVYQDARPRALMADAPLCPPAARPGVGGMVDVNMTLCPLPADAQPIGWSEVAVGQVARQTQLPRGNAYGRAPGLGGALAGALGGGMLFAPGIGGGATAGVAPVALSGGGLGQAQQSSAGLGFTFAEAVIVNVLVSVVAGVVSTMIFKNAFVRAGKAA